MQLSELICVLASREKVRDGWIWMQGGVQSNRDQHTRVRLGLLNQPQSECDSASVSGITGDGSRHLHQHGSGLTCRLMGASGALLQPALTVSNRVDASADCPWAFFAVTATL